MDIATIDPTTGEITADFEALCDEAREAADQLDEGRWAIGRIAAEVETQYGAHTIANMATNIGIEKRRVWEYQRVHKFYELCAAADYRSANPMLRYSHFRTAMRLKSPDDALEFLNECSRDGLTAEQAGIKLNERLGKPTPPQKIVDFEGEWFAMLDNLRTAMMARGSEHPARVRLVVTEV